MPQKSPCDIAFVRLPEIAPQEILRHMTDPRVAEHMPLLVGAWDDEAVVGFVTAKEACWHRDGLGHWAILYDGHYVGWGGFQKEGEEWDFGLVLKPEHFGIGMRITRQAIEFARTQDQIPFVTFLLPPSRKNVGALKRFGAKFVTKIDYEGEQFLKYRLDTS